MSFFEGEMGALVGSIYDNLAAKPTMGLLPRAFPPEIGSSSLLVFLRTFIPRSLGENDAFHFLSEKQTEVIYGPLATISILLPGLAVNGKAGAKKEEKKTQ